MKMKLEAELSGVIEKMKEIEEKIKLHAEHLRKTGGYKDFETRLAWDALRAVVGSNTICKWYSDYDCNDKHIDTLAKRALKHVYPISK